MEPSQPEAQTPIPQPENTPVSPAPQQLNSGGMKVIQPTIGTVSAEPAQAAPVVVGAQPLAAPVSATASPVVSQGIYPQPQSLTRAEIEAGVSKENKKKLAKRLALIVPVIIALILGAGVWSYYAGLLPISKFRTITYNNGIGSSFRLKFYADYSVVNVPNSSDGSQELIATKDSITKAASSGQFPIALLIGKGSSAGYKEYSDCTGQGVEGVELSIKNNPTDSTINLCRLYIKGATFPVAYVGFIKSGNNYHIILIDQALDSQKINDKDQAYIKLMKQRINLSNYNNDITKIVSSIKPLQ